MSYIIVYVWMCICGCVYVDVGVLIENIMFETVREMSEYLYYLYIYIRGHTIHKNIPKCFNYRTCSTHHPTQRHKTLDPTIHCVCKDIQK
jgi:hypothetical protein